MTFHFVKFHFPGFSKIHFGTFTCIVRRTECRGTPSINPEQHIRTHRLLWHYDDISLMIACKQSWRRPWSSHRHTLPCPTSTSVSLTIPLLSLHPRLLSYSLCTDQRITMWVLHPDTLSTMRPRREYSLSNACADQNLQTLRPSLRSWRRKSRKPSPSSAPTIASNA